MTSLSSVNTALLSVTIKATFMNWLAQLYVPLR
jgi:hypothetical protein